MSEIIPAILTADAEDLKEKLEKLQGLTDWVQIDIGDGEFAPSETIGVKELASLKSDFKIGLHLMVSKPQDYLAAAKQAGVARVIFSIEAVDDPKALLEEIKSQGQEAGIALNPETPIEKVKPFLDQADTILLLSVNPGRQGQEFIPEVLTKIKNLKAVNSKIKIEADGGINLTNIKQVAEAGADYLVVGSAIVNQPDMARAINNLKSALD